MTTIAEETPLARRRRRWELLPYWLILPTVVYLGLFFVWPMIQGFGLALRDEVSGHDAEMARTFRLVTDAILLPRAFACLSGPEGIAAIAFGVRAGPWLVIESVAVREAQRNRGLARQTVGALLDWGRREGATAACLQVEATNAPAVALYQRLGFARELYRYHYRVKA